MSFRAVAAIGSDTGAIEKYLIKSSNIHSFFFFIISKDTLFLRLDASTKAFLFTFAAI